ncbi:hypothetical protein EC968_005784 [Mortierella alpina]|nr:hypothetical protein EC968_005784 [Mortierella alpina]
MPSSTRDLIPASLSSYLNLTTSGDNSNHSSNHDPSSRVVDPSSFTELRTQLNKIPRRSWLKLGAECHNSGFAAEIALTVVSKPTASSSMSISAMAAAKAAAAAGPALNLANGLPKIIETIERRRQQHMNKVVPPSSLLSSDTQQQPRALLWDMYFFYQDHCSSSSNSSNHRHSRAVRETKLKSASSSSFSSSAPAAWQLQFLKSACPEVTVLAFANAFLEYGPKRGFVDRDVPIDLVQFLDYEWRSDSAPARRAVLALVQTMIACRRYVKAINNNTIDPVPSGTKPSPGIPGLGAKRGGSGPASAAPVPQETGAQQQQKADFENGCHQLAKTLADAWSSLEVFFSTETGRTLPKLQSLLQQEMAADIKAHSKTGPAGLERGIKRPAASSSSLGMAGSRDMGAAGPDALDPVTKKRLKETTPFGSPSQLARQGSNDSDSVKSSPALSSSSSSLSKGAGNDTLEDRPPIGTLLSTKHILERIQTGQLAANNAAQQQQQQLLPSQQTAVATSSLSSLGQQQQAKLSNPLWSPILGLNYLPQSPQKYMVQVEAELARWISLLGHMDGVVFNDKLTSLIRAVYPSDQKFLLDLLLIEYMSWEGTEGQELLDMDSMAAPPFLEDAFHHQVSNRSSTTEPNGKHHKGSSSTLKSGEWILEVILGAFVGLVMKPEDSNTYLEPGSKKWSESIEVLEDEDEDENEEGDGRAGAVGGASGVISKSTTAGTTTATAGAAGVKSANATATSTESGTSSTTTTTTPARPSIAMGGGSAMMAKKRRMRTLYNRRVSPFYATLLMFQPKRVVGRVQGVLYLSHEELDSSQAEVSSNPGAGGVAGKDAEALLKQATETAHQLKTSLAVDKTEPSPEEQIRSRMELKKLRRQQRKAHRKGRYAKKIDLDADPDAQAANASHNSHGMAGGKWRDKTKSDYDAELDMHDDEKDSATSHSTGPGIGTHPSAGNNNNNSSNASAAVKTEDERKDVVMSEAGDDGGHAELDLDVLSASLAFNPQDHYQGWMEETLEEDELLLAKRAETARVVCHAPFKVLMFILQYLTRMNQSGALDAWITDALSGTAFVLQVQYFEWVLSTLLFPKKVTGRSTSASSRPTTTATKGVAAADGVVLLEEELLRLLPLLMAAPGIGHKPVKTARSIVEQTLHHLQDQTMEDVRSEYSQTASESEYWKRVRAMLEGHGH